jgi:peptidoglycan/LPS O-acetylase OafA/YrhL
LSKGAERVVGYDFIRSLAILIVFLGHILDKQATNWGVLLAIRSLSPGLTMSLLGFISAALLSAKEYDFGTFLVRRFTRIYIPLVSCLSVILAAHALIGKKVITQHALLHLMGLSAFFELFGVQDKATIGAALWFITAIISMYLLFPLLQKLFRHPRGFLHLVLALVAFTGLNYVTYVQSAWNVAISFSVGVYLGANAQINRLLNAGTARSILFSIGLVVVTALATEGILPYKVRGLLYSFYPLAFVPFLFAVAKKLPPAIVTAVSFFAGLSYEFYILHPYFINNRFQDFFPASTNLGTQIAISFIATLILSYVISNFAAWCRKIADQYLLVN